MRRLIQVCLLIFPLTVYAEAPPAGNPEPPDIPMPVQSGETLEPEPDITIIRRGKKTIQEYRINGELYKVKIIPDVGPAYYMIDSDGDGNMEIRGPDFNESSNINQWKIYSWK